MPSDLPRLPFAELVEELRRLADLAAEDLVGIAASATVEGEAADVLEELRAALAAISGGCADPQRIAREALQRISDEPEDALRALLRPRRV